MKTLIKIKVPNKPGFVWKKTYTSSSGGDSQEDSPTAEKFYHVVEIDVEYPQKAATSPKPKLSWMEIIIDHLAILTGYLTVKGFMSILLG